MKQKLATLLRAWAQRLSPEPSRPALLRFVEKRHYTRMELLELTEEPETAPIVDGRIRRDLARRMGEKLMVSGALRFHTEQEACPDSHDVLVATVTAQLPGRPRPTIARNPQNHSRHEI